MSQTEYVRGKIIRIIDKRTIIVNLGFNVGITGESFFDILGEPEDVIDPFTEEILGSVSVVKARLKADSVYEKFTIATTKWETRSFILPNILTPREIDKGELIVKDKDVEPWLARSKTPVQIGDLVEVKVRNNNVIDEEE